MHAWAARPPRMSRMQPGTDTAEAERNRAHTCVTEYMGCLEYVNYFRLHVTLRIVRWRQRWNHRTPIILILACVVNGMFNRLVA